MSCTTRWKNPDFRQDRDGLRTDGRENSASRSHAIYGGLTLAEYLRDEKNQDVLLFIDNIYRAVQAYSEISAMENRMPIENGYPATLDSDVSEIEERD